MTSRCSNKLEAAAELASLRWRRMLDLRQDDIAMNAHPIEITSGIVLFRGRISHNLSLEPMVSHAYFLEDGDEVIIFDPSCGKQMAKGIESHVRSRHEAKVERRSMRYLRLWHVKYSPSLAAFPGPLQRMDLSSRSHCGRAICSPLRSTTLR